LSLDAAAPNSQNLEAPGIVSRIANLPGTCVIKQATILHGHIPNTNWTKGLGDPDKLYVQRN
jgi:hypothetical protein